MNVRVRLGAGLVPAAGSSRLVLTLAEAATVTDLLNHLCRQHPELAPKIDKAVPVVSGRHVTLTERLADGQEIAFLLPIAGGAR
jgi:molybdopterin synthase sulfur carrier subunit